METNSTFRGNPIVMLDMVQKDNPGLSEFIAWAVARRLLERPGEPGACVHQMPQGMSSFKDGICVRCGSTESVPDPKPVPTPGPWNIHRCYPVDSKVLRIEEGDFAFNAWSCRIAKGDAILGEVYWTDAKGGFGHPSSVEEAKANAMVMMASAELLAALQAVEWSDLGRCPQCAGRGIHQPACIVGDALAKASGKCA